MSSVAAFTGGIIAGPHYAASKNQPGAWGLTHFLASRFPPGHRSHRERAGPGP